MAIDNVALVKRFVEEVWNKGNMKVADELASNTSTFHDPLSKDLRSLDAFKKYVVAMRTGFPDLHVAIDDIGTVGDNVYLRWTVTGTHKGMYMGVAATNKRSIVVGMSENRIQNGKIIETWMSYDVLGFLQQLGIAQQADRLSQAVATALAH